MEIGYYPGCALHGSSNDYETSVRACLALVGVGLRELDDWICCGATAAHSLNHKLAVALPARNLGLAQRDGVGDLLAPCPMCSMQLIKANCALAQSDERRKDISDVVELDVQPTTRVLNLIQVFQKIGVEQLKKIAVKPLTGFRPACYYGCLLTRAPAASNGDSFDDCERPQSMESLLSALGAEPVEWNYRTECCGAGMTLANEETVLELSHKILDNAESHGANCMVVACPMCHVNLDMKQADIERHRGVRHDMVVYYLSDAIGLALGIDEKQLGIDRHFVVRR